MFIILIPIVLALVSAGSAAIAAACAGTLLAIGISAALFTEVLTAVGSAAVLAGIHWLDNQLTLDFGAVPPEAIAAIKDGVDSGMHDSTLLDPSTGHYFDTKEAAAAALVPMMSQRDPLRENLALDAENYASSGYWENNGDGGRSYVGPDIPTTLATLPPADVDQSNAALKARITGHLIQVRYHNAYNNPTDRAYQLTPSPAQIAAAQAAAAAAEAAKWQPVDFYIHQIEVKYFPNGQRTRAAWNAAAAEVNRLISTELANQPELGSVLKLQFLSNYPINVPDAPGPAAAAAAPDVGPITPIDTGAPLLRSTGGKVAAAGGVLGLLGAAVAVLRSARR